MKKPIYQEAPRDYQVKVSYENYDLWHSTNATTPAQAIARIQKKYPHLQDANNFKAVLR